MTEYLLTTDSFKKPTVLKDNDARGKLLLNLLLLTPGKNPLFPEMGCGLLRYRHIMEGQIGEVQNLITKQVETYLPECLADTISLSVKNRKYLSVQITCKDDVAFVYNSEDSEFPIEVDDFSGLNSEYSDDDTYGGISY